ncbi:hypothetical protein MAR_035813 [Mya arenaria]|uniref:Uncharacterized protein n=1 Tax=Mya arenaria TaxID=6604 RepID=A0ABY7EP56_MYAAR|nr:hypothetical protein MAR_035813 [Mya arenaria]
MSCGCVVVENIDTSRLDCIPDPYMTREAFWQNVVLSLSGKNQKRQISFAVKKCRMELYADELYKNETRIDSDLAS